MSFRVITAGLLCVLALSGCGSSSASKTVIPSPTSSADLGFTVGLVTDVGGLNDKSFNQEANLGMQMAEKQFGVKGKVIESKSFGDYVPNLTSFAQQHTGLTIAIGFSMANAVYQVATTFPTQKFALVDSAPADAKGRTVKLPNVADIFFKEREAGYLVGVIAGLMEKNRVGKATHNTIGFLGGMSIPEVDRYIAGYVAGAHRVDPGLRILGGYAQSFNSASAGGTIGRSQIARGADILFQVAAGSGLGYLSAAEQRGVYGIGADVDQSYLGKFVIASAIKRVDIAVRDTIRAAQLGHFTPGNQRFGLKENGTGFVVSTATVPANIISQAKFSARQIADGKIVPPKQIPRY